MLASVQADIASDVHKDACCHVRQHFIQQQEPQGPVAALGRSRSRKEQRQQQKIREAPAPADATAVWGLTPEETAEGCPGALHSLTQDTAVC